MATSTIKQVNPLITRLTMTYTNNTWVTSAQFARLSAYEKYGIYTLYGNLQINSSETTEDFVEIGRINGWETTNNLYFEVAGQDPNSGVLLVGISIHGVISIFSNNSPKAGSFYRFQLTAF